MAVGGGPRRRDGPRPGRAAARADRRHGSAAGRVGPAARRRPVRQRDRRRVGSEDVVGAEVAQPDGGLSVGERHAAVRAPLHLRRAGHTAREVGDQCSVHGAGHTAREVGDQCSVHGAGHTAREVSDECSVHGAGHTAREVSDECNVHGAGHTAREVGDQCSVHGAGHTAREVGDECSVHGAGHTARDVGDQCSVHGAGHTAREVGDQCSVHGAGHTAREVGDECSVHGAGHTARVVGDQSIKYIILCFYLYTVLHQVMYQLALIWHLICTKGTLDASMNVSVPPIRTAAICKSFTYTGAVAWNALPNDVKCSDSLSMFKRVRIVAGVVIIFYPFRGNQNTYFISDFISSQEKPGLL